MIGQRCIIWLQGIVFLAAALGGRYSCGIGGAGQTCSSKPSLDQSGSVCVVSSQTRRITCDHPSKPSCQAGVEFQFLTKSQDWKQRYHPDRLPAAAEALSARLPHNEGEARIGALGLHCSVSQTLDSLRTTVLLV